MTKADIINRVSEELGIDRQDRWPGNREFHEMREGCTRQREKCIPARIRDLFFEEKGGKEGTEYPTAHNHMHPGSQGPSF